MRTIRIFIPVFVLFILTVNPQQLFTQDVKPEGDCMKAKKHGIPDLTEEQKEKIEAVKLDHKKQKMQLKNELNEKMAHKKTLMTSDDVDMQEINKTIDEIGAIKTEMMKKDAAHIQEIRSLLTDEQRIYFDSHRHHAVKRHAKPRKSMMMHKKKHHR